MMQLIGFPSSDIFQPNLIQMLANLSKIWPNLIEMPPFYPKHCQIYTKCHQIYPNQTKSKCLRIVNNGLELNNNFIIYSTQIPNPSHQHTTTTNH